MATARTVGAAARCETCFDSNLGVRERHLMSFPTAHSLESHLLDNFSDEASRNGLIDAIVRAWHCKRRFESWDG